MNNALSLLSSIVTTESREVFAPRSTARYLAMMMRDSAVLKSANAKFDLNCNLLQKQKEGSIKCYPVS